MNAGGDRARSGIGRRLAPPRFLAFLILLPIAYFGYRQLTGASDWRDSAAMAFDIAALGFLLMMSPLLRDSTVEAMRRHARENDAGRLGVLIVTTMLMLVVMAAISGQLEAARGGAFLPLLKLAATLLLIWLFANVIYALHYAHAYYADDPGGKDGNSGGFDFPGGGSPGYQEFLYFAFTLGMTFQTSDVAITNTAMRRIALLHGFSAFVFNIGVVAFVINVLGGGQT